MIIFQNSTDTVEVIGYVRGPRVIIKRTLFRHKWPAFHWTLVVEWSPEANEKMMQETYGNLGKNKKFYTVIHEEFIPYHGSWKNNKKSRNRLEQLRREYSC